MKEFYMILFMMYATPDGIKGDTIVNSTPFPDWVACFEERDKVGKSVDAMIAKKKNPHFSYQIVCMESPVPAKKKPEVSA